MKNHLTSIIIGLVIIVGAGSLVYFTKKPIVVPSEGSTNEAQSVSTSTQNIPVTGTESDDDDDDKIPAPVIPTKPTPAPSGITLAQIAGHNSRSSCWSAINGGVYDLTSWIPNHPGGEQAILSLCGIDGSSKYNGQHGGNPKTATVLGGFKIGVIAK